VVPTKYRKNTSVTKDSHGNVASAKLVIPAGTSMPERVRAYVIGDVNPLLVRDV
jgi:hypothetical protein